MSEVYWQGTAPTQCDICKQSLFSCFSDGKTIMGPWANMCDVCQGLYGYRYNQGLGQRYERQEDGRYLKVAG